MDMSTQAQSYIYVRLNICRALIDREVTGVGLWMEWGSADQFEGWSQPMLFEKLTSDHAPTNEVPVRGAGRRIGVLWSVT